MKCFVINLDRDKDRLSKFDNEWKRAKIPFKYERVRAVDGSLLDNINNINIAPCTDPKKFACPRPLTKGEIGCFLSHKFVWGKLLSSNEKWAVVFEDDIKISPQISQFIIQDNWIPEGVDFIQIFVWGEKQKIKILNEKELFNGFKLYQQVKPFPSGTQAYIFSRKFAELAVNYSNILYAPVDDFISNPAYPINSFVKVWRLNPALVTTNDAIPSSIQHFKENLKLQVPLKVKINPKKFYLRFKWSLIRKFAKNKIISFYGHN